MDEIEFVGRKDWGARYAAGMGARSIPCAEAWVHHSLTLSPDLAFTDLNADATDDDEAKAMRDIEAIGQQRFGYGFSYNLAAMPSGRLYVGCGVRRIGSHTRKRNTRALGVVLVGDYRTRIPPQPMQDALVRLLRFADSEGWLNRPAFDGGHRDVVATGCPGDAAYSLIPAMNARAAQAAEPARPPVQEDDDMQARLIKSPERGAVFGFNGVQRWHIQDPDVRDDLIRIGAYGDGTVHTVAQATLDAIPLLTEEI